MWEEISRKSRIQAVAWIFLDVFSCNYGENASAKSRERFDKLAV
jgi:hypothetical protein